MKPNVPQGEAQVILAQAEVRPWSLAHDLYGWKWILLRDLISTCVKSGNRNGPF